MSAVLAAAVVLTAALALGLVLLLRTRLLRRRTTASAYFAAAVACAVAAGLWVPGGPAGSGGPARPVAGGPLLGSLGLGARQVPVLVVPNRPGYNLVAVGADGASAGTGRDRLVKGERRPGSTLTWVPVELPAGPARVWVSAGGALAPLAVDTGRAGGGGP
ncbi:hypothetical protein ABZW32_39415, partial [Streptomyces sp. NPDC004667]